MAADTPLIATRPLAAPTQAPEALSLLALERAHNTRLLLVCAAVLLIALVALLGWWRATERWASESRLAYIKLSPDGTWAIDRDLGESISYYEATWRTVVYDWIERRYSKRSGTIVTDWGVAWAMYAPPLQDWFANEFQASRVAAEHAACSSCPQVVTRARTHAHIDPLPESLGQQASAPVRTLIYATETTTAAGSTRPISELRKVLRVTWRVLPKRAVMGFDSELLRYNPIGIQILDVEVSDDPN